MVDLPPRGDGPHEDGDETVDPGARKERVLHTRVPDSLDRHIKRRARSLGMSASTVVRNVLLTTFGLVEDIVNDSADIALAVTGKHPDPTRLRARSRGGDASDGGPSPVLAWQDAVLNRNAVCDDCNAILHKGQRAAIGIREDAGPRAIICPACLAKLQGAEPASRKRAGR
jgi:hypothetical protein